MTTESTNQMHARLIRKSRLFYACPHCDTEKEITHLLELEHDQGVIDWECKACGWIINGHWSVEHQALIITSVKETPKDLAGFMLLRINPSKVDHPVWFVVEEKVYVRNGEVPTLEEIFDNKTYWVNEHTCPTNIVGVEAIIEGSGPTYDDDPHGVLEFVAWAPKPDDWPADSNLWDWQLIFPQLCGDTIEGVSVSSPLLLVQDENNVI